MKNIFILLFLTLSFFTNAQTELTYIPASKSVIGIWRQTGIGLANGETVDRLTGNYKVINADSTYFTFVTWSNETTIGHYGSYEITSDSTWVEHIIIHSMNSDLNGKDQFTKFELIDKNTMYMAWSPDAKSWVNEKWTRLPLSRTPNNEEVVIVGFGTQKAIYQNVDATDYNIDEDSLAVKGYDLTEYFIKNKASKGSSKYQFTYNGIKYYFMNEKNKSIFIENPEKYLPQFGGYCADKMGAVFIGGSKPGKHDVNPEYFMIIDNKLYLFSYKGNGDLYFQRWRENKDSNLEDAYKVWETISHQN